MIIGHLPTGYLAATAFRAAGVPRQIALAFLVGSVLPDLDMLWFLLVDQGAVHHHTYVTHKPSLWAGLVVFALGLHSARLVAIGLGAVFHLMLDSIVGHIDWGWPLGETIVTLVEVPATQSNWVLSFVYHWTFACELAITVCPAAVAGWHWHRGRPLF